jgi:hypothetical protein
MQQLQNIGFFNSSLGTNTTLVSDHPLKANWPFLQGK